MPQIPIFDFFFRVAVRVQNTFFRRPKKRKIITMCGGDCYELTNRQKMTDVCNTLFEQTENSFPVNNCKFSAFWICFIWI